MQNTAGKRQVEAQQQQQGNKIQNLPLPSPTIKTYYKREKTNLAW